jgi:tetratricopeptide (TPR) repeat protein
VYGKLLADDVESSFVPAFYLSPAKLRGAEELAGPYPLGGSIKVVGDAVTNPAARAAIRIRLARRAGALTELLIGLGYSAIGRREEALRRFRAARAQAPWNDQGQALLLQLAGNARGAVGDLNGAQRDYRAALARSPGYARALFGIAELTYQRGRGECSSTTARPLELRRASREYRGVLAADSQPSLRIARTVLRAKVAMGIARIDYCTARAGVGVRLSDARREFTSVATNGKGAPELRTIIAEAHGYLGYIALPPRGAANPRSSLLSARTHFRLASELATSPELRKDNLAALAFVLLRLGDRAGAARAYGSAAHYERARSRRAKLLIQSSQARNR